MAKKFYMYQVRDLCGVEYTSIKWFDSSIHMRYAKIDKPTADLTPEDLVILQEFIDGGMIIQDKTDFL
jgi:hypothetical protein